MHALVIALGSHGDIHPMLGIALGLRERGHGVTFVASPYFEPLARKAGFDDFVPLGTFDEFRHALANPDLWHPLKGFKAVFQHGVLPATQPTFDAIARRYIPFETVVVAHAIALGARIAQDKLGVPTATVQLAPAVFRSMHQPPRLPGLHMPDWLPLAVKRAMWWMIDTLVIDRLLAPPINQIRADVGLPPVRHILDNWWLSPDLVLGLFPDWFASKQPDWPAQLRLTQFPLYDEGDVEPVSPELEAFLGAGEPPIVFTPGSAMTFGQSFFRESATACEILNRRGILLSRHREHIPTDLPTTVRHFDYAPFSRILPRCAALVHHGGIGTTSQALAAGIPQLVMPMAHDQFDNAQRVAHLGAGDWIKRRNYQAKPVAAKLNALLTNSHIASACRHIAARFLDVDPMAKTCDLIEELYAHTGQQGQPSRPAVV
ncbi:MAG TPA: nucleotide disphospho-sugar-binding domain-containing protein [Tepidisphaeraceae bacterium]|nr:nucleotide disphospho-sugar-binding domain-containing protein [Tepidisphaeraceae bacterium]